MPNSPEARARAAERMRERHKDPAFGKMLREASARAIRKRNADPEFRARSAERMRQRRKDPEFEARRLAAYRDAVERGRIGRSKDPMSGGRRARLSVEERRARLSEAMRRRRQDPAFEEKRLTALRQAGKEGRLNPRRQAPARTKAEASRKSTAKAERAAYVRALAGQRSKWDPVHELGAADGEDLRRIGQNLRGKGYTRARGGEMAPGCYDLCQLGERFFARYWPGEGMEE